MNDSKFIMNDSKFIMNDSEFKLNDSKFNSTFEAFKPPIAQGNVREASSLRKGRQ